MKFKKMLYTLPIAIASMLPIKEAKGQDVIWLNSAPLPKEPINFFITQDSAEQLSPYDLLNNKAERDNVLVTKVNNDIAGKVIGTTELPWVCWRTAVLFYFNSQNSGKKILMSDKPVYDNYNGENIDSIKIHGGTTKYFCTEKIPAYGVEIADNHEMSIAITGDYINKATDWNFMEVGWPWNMTNVQPGQAYIPLTTNYIMIRYYYLYEDKNGKKNYANIPAVLFKLKDGKYEFVATNPYVKIIMERESDPPIINIDNNTNPNTLEYSIIEENFNKAYFKIDNDTTKIMIPQSGTINMGLLAGTHNITVTATDYFRKSTTTTLERKIEPPTLEKTILYPNPAEDIMHIKYKSNMSQNAYRTIYTLDGKPVERKTIGQMTEEDLDITTLKRGMYIMNIIDGKEKQNLKFIKE